MLREISASIEERRVRHVLWVLAALSTVGLVPVALLGILVGARGAYYAKEGWGEPLVAALLGLMGTIGIIGGWTRILVSNERLQRSKTLRAAVASSIALGIVTAVPVVAATWREAGVVAVLVATVAVIGVYLLFATIGVNRDAI